MVVARWTGDFGVISIARRVRRSLASVVTSPVDGSLGDEQAMPSQDCIRREPRANFLETFATENLACDCQTAPLVVGEQDAFFAQFLFQHLVSGPQVFDHLLLLAAHPAGKIHQEQLPWLQNKGHGQAVGCRGFSESSSPGSGYVWESMNPSATS